MITVLVVDDVPDVTALLKRKLEATGRFRVVSANSGAEALRVAAEARPAVVVCDIDMPGMDGGTVAAELGEREGTRGTPVIFLSTLVTPEDAGSDAGRRPVVSKQSPVDELVRTIDQVLAAE